MIKALKAVLAEWLEDYQDSARGFAEAVLSKVAHARFGVESRRRFYRTLLLLHRNNMEMRAALEEVYANYSDDGRKVFNITAIVAKDCVDSIRNGKVLAEAIGPWVPTNEMTLIAAGEAAGNLEKGFLQALEEIDHVEAVTSTVMELKHFVVLWAGVGYLLNQVGTTLVPEIVKSSSPETWTFEVRVLKLISDVVNTCGYLGAMAGVTIVLIVFMSLPYFTGPFRRLLDDHWIWAYYRDLQGCSFLKEVTMLESSGIELREALEYLEGLAKPWLREKLGNVLRSVRNGSSLGDALFQSGEGFPNPEAIRYLRSITGRAGAGNSVEEFATEWASFTIARIKRAINGYATLALMLVYGVFFLIFAGINALGNSAISSGAGF